MAYGVTGFHIDGPSMCAESLETSLRLSDWDDFNEDLAGLRITHVIAPTGLGNGGRPLDFGARGVDDLVQDDEYEVVSRLLIERGEIVQTVNDQSLFRLSPTTSG